MYNLQKNTLLTIALLLLTACAIGSTRGRYYCVIFNAPSSSETGAGTLAVSVAEAFRDYGFRESYPSNYFPNGKGEFGRLIFNKDGKRAVIFFNSVSKNVVDISVLADESLLHENRFSNLLNTLRAACETLSAEGKARFEYNEGGGSFIK